MYTCIRKIPCIHVVIVYICITIVTEAEFWQTCITTVTEAALGKLLDMSVKKI